MVFKQFAVLNHTMRVTFCIKKHFQVKWRLLGHHLLHKKCNVIRYLSQSNCRGFLNCFPSHPIGVYQRTRKTAVAISPYADLEGKLPLKTIEGYTIYIAPFLVMSYSMEFLPEKTSLCKVCSAHETLTKSSHLPEIISSIYRLFPCFLGIPFWLSSIGLSLEFSLHNFWLIAIIDRYLEYY